MFYSTRNRDDWVDSKRAVLNGIAPDGGLYLPAEVKPFPSSFFDDIKNCGFLEISKVVASRFFKSIPQSELNLILKRALTFNAPLIQLNEKLHFLELFHGPTLAFKDFGARFMAELFRYFTQNLTKQRLILVATSGDTGSAVASGFLNKADIQVILLYPGNKVSHIQEQQLTTLGQNVTAFEVEGTFDDCQKLVKKAFSDSDLIQNFLLTSANSINIARLLPQSFYYFYAWAQLKTTNEIVFIVPSGNFGNLTAGLIAGKLGLPVKKYIAATNANRVFVDYLHSGHYKPRKSIKTISNAMDVGAPSNFERILSLFENNYQEITNLIIGFSISDDETLCAINDLNEYYHYIADPHSAVGYAAYKQYLKENPDRSVAVMLGTAHAAKFIDVLPASLAERIQMPPRLKACLNRQKHSILIKNDYKQFKRKLLDHLS